MRGDKIKETTVATVTYSGSSSYMYLDLSAIYPYAVGPGNVWAGLGIGLNLSAESSSDADSADTRTFVWTESDPGTWFNDLNGNGVLDAWEGFGDSFDADGFNPIQEDGELHTGDGLSRELYPGGHAFGVTTTDNYGDSHSAAVALYVHHESNDASSASAHNNSVSSFMDNGGVHYLPPGASTTNVQIWGGSVADGEGDGMTASTSVNGDAYSSQGYGTGAGDTSVNGVVDDFGVGTHTVEICVQDSYGGYQYQELFNADGSAQIDNINEAKVSRGAFRKEQSHYGCESTAEDQLLEPGVIGS